MGHMTTLSQLLIKRNKFKIFWKKLFLQHDQNFCQYLLLPFFNTLGK